MVLSSSVDPHETLLHGQTFPRSAKQIDAGGLRTLPLALDRARGSVADPDRRNRAARWIEDLQVQSSNGTGQGEPRGPGPSGWIRSHGEPHPSPARDGCNSDPDVLA